MAWDEAIDVFNNQLSNLSNDAFKAKYSPAFLQSPRHQKCQINRKEIITQGKNFSDALEELYDRRISDKRRFFLKSLLASATRALEEPSRANLEILENQVKTLRSWVDTHKNSAKFTGHLLALNTSFLAIGSGALIGGGLLFSGIITLGLGPGGAVLMGLSGIFVGVAMISVALYEGYKNYRLLTGKPVDEIEKFVTVLKQSATTLINDNSNISDDPDSEEQVDDQKDCYKP